MTKRFCDRCQREEDTFMPKLYLQTVNLSPIGNRDLCGYCVEELTGILKLWMEGKNKK